MQNYCSEILDYIDQLIGSTSLTISPDFIKDIYELYSDIIQFYGTHFRQKIRTLSATQKLSVNIVNFDFDGMQSVKERFFN